MSLGVPGCVVMLLPSKSIVSESGVVTASGFSDSKNVTLTLDAGRDPPVDPLEVIRIRIYHSFLFISSD